MQDFETIEASIWSELKLAVTQPGHDWRLPVFGTGSGTDTGTDSAWDIRTVVLRDVDRTALTLICHSDVRAGKVAAVRSADMVRWLFYDRLHHIQIKVTATATVHTADAIADTQWNQTPVSSRKAYLAPRAPGTAAEGPDFNLPPEFCESLPTEQQVQAGRNNFAVISTHVQSIEWLNLQRTGNLRAVIDYDEGFTARWIAP